MSKKAPSYSNRKSSTPLPKYVVPLISLALIAVGAYVAIQFAKGYRPTIEGLEGTGLLNATSQPEGAEVYIDDKLTTAADDVLNLDPGEYDVRIRQEGYIDWVKKLKIENELVTQTNAELFRQVPSLDPLTLTGAENIVPSPDGLKIAFVVTSSQVEGNNGLYVVDLSQQNQFSIINQQTRHLAKNITRDFTEANLLWSPDSNQIMAYFDEESENGEATYLLNAYSFNEIDKSPDVSIQLKSLLSDWEEEIVTRESKQLASLEPEIADILTNSAIDLYFSPNDEKVAYIATASASIPEVITDLPARNNQPENRAIERGNVYVYDTKEDKNFLLTSVSLDSPIDLENYKVMLDLSLYTPEATAAATQPENNTVYNRLQAVDDVIQTFANFAKHYSSIHTRDYQWYPNSNHLLLTSEDKIEVIEYDATNRATLYDGALVDDFVYPWPDGTKLIVITKLNSTATPNLYSLEVK